MCQNAIAGILDDGSALHWSEVTASSLLGIREDNEIVENGSLGGQPEESAACIHLGLREHSYFTSPKAFLRVQANFFEKHLFYRVDICF